MLNKTTFKIAITSELLTEIYSIIAKNAFVTI